MNDTRKAVLDALDDGPVTGPDLAAQLDVSRAAVWKHVEALREDGFEIDSGDDGYRLESVPEFGGPAVEYGLDAPFDVEYHESVPSTNVVARELADDGASDVAVLADEQTGGKGRLDREWTSPSGGVWLSVVLRPDLPPARVPMLTLAAAVAATDAAREAGVDAEIKWPNDVLVGDRKLVGILTEMEGEADRVSWVIPGIGVNANIPADELPEGAVSLQTEVGPVERRLFVQRLLERLDELRSDPDAILDAWRERSATLGQEVRVETPEGIVEGVAKDVDLPGTLLVETDDGVERIHAGDCEHLRPA
ncbi:BirA family transcriptional regulator, biotin operon repressor / biotin-[acetyl-CoA-carboxylase] ligase [Natronoarchaeum philippinense]|uniref:BirA family transcriptional regulator, biotin operon repressor / biotin-[acetyl-CoA-carboxylase] ligase n=1 Tax=Natronoarchaeum philippinense TaxID=558529 RepID=A0A285N540_NATPI|nr:biotin--[acetyl-CoA-carboxylase] ligase [Natronoarchaeum philippinense]SNZ04562.1 BirA family transcriptional regulator, biotin operon repressor / biotin-[acetyl-CoA-carboxylase] ligase [Natronoarchaeum philippinense]